MSLITTIHLNQVCWSRKTSRTYRTVGSEDQGWRPLTDGISVDMVTDLCWTLTGFYAVCLWLHTPGRKQKDPGVELKNISFIRFVPHTLVKNNAPTKNATSFTIFINKITSSTLDSGTKTALAAVGRLPRTAVKHRGFWSCAPGATREERLAD